MKQIKILLIASLLMLLSTYSYANGTSANMAPIISYLLSGSDTQSTEPHNFTMVLDVDESTATGNWKLLSSVKDLDAVATVLVQGNYGTFVVTEDSLAYLKTIETNETDTGILEIIDGTETVEITVTINSLYWKQVSAGDSHTTAIKNDGTLWAWGRNHYGQIGNGSTVNSSIPIQEITNSINWSFVSAGQYHTTAIKNDGTLWTWGNNGWGQLGNGSTTNSSTPIQEETNSSNWSTVSAGGRHTAAIKSNGTLWSWGGNSYGQLGDDTVTYSLVPIQEVTHSSNWSFISVRQQYTTAIKSNGTLWTWGYNGTGQLGNGSTTNSSTPIQVETNSSNWSTVSAGGSHTTAIKSDGTLWSWGSNYNSQLGNGTTTDSSIPIQEITYSTNWSSVCAGYYHSTAIKSDGTLWSWGDNYGGQLGNGTTTNSSTPIQEITNSTNWSSVSAGYFYSMAIQSGSSLWAWGGNYYGQFGNGTTTGNSIPVKCATNSTTGAL